MTRPRAYKRPAGWQHIEAFIDPTARVPESARVEWYAVVQSHVAVGERCIIWNGARLLPCVVLEDDVMIGGGTEIGRGSRIGTGSRIGANCFFPSDTQIGVNVFVGPGVVCTDDRYPRVAKPGDPPYHAEPPTIEDGANIGARAVLLPGVRIGAGALVAAGAIVTDDVGPGEMVRCEPARVYALGGAVTA